MQQFNIYTDVKTKKKSGLHFNKWLNFVRFTKFYIAG